MRRAIRGLRKEVQSEEILNSAATHAAANYRRYPLKRDIGSLIIVFMSVRVVWVAVEL